MHPVTFRIGTTEVRTEWNDSETAQRLLAVLPLEAVGNYWGQEFYFETPVQAPADRHATDVVEPGTVAFWPAGGCLCLFWGPTPVSRGGECRAASKVNLVGRVLNPEVLKALKHRKVRVEAGDATAGAA